MLYNVYYFCRTSKMPAKEITVESLNHARIRVREVCNFHTASDCLINSRFTNFLITLASFTFRLILRIITFNSLIIKLVNDMWMTLLAYNGIGIFIFSSINLYFSKFILLVTCLFFIYFSYFLTFFFEQIQCFPSFFIIGGQK